MLVTILALALGQAPDATAQQQPLHDAVFRPLKKAERVYAPLEPAGTSYPEAAVKARRNGEATLSRRVTARGDLQKCKPFAERRPKFDFGLGAQVMADRKRIFVADAPPAGKTILVRAPFVLGAPASVE